MAKSRWVLRLVVLCVLLATAQVVAAAPHAPRAMSNEELVETRRQLPLGGPISLVVLGSTLVLVALPVTVLGVYNLGLCESSAGCSNGGLVAGVTLATTGLIAGIGGGVWLGNRIQRRKALDHELERRQLGVQDLRLTVVPRLGGGVLGLSGTF